jgi:hypothetical protein
MVHTYRLRVHSTCRDEEGAWTDELRRLALAGGPRAGGRAVVRLLGPSPELLAPAEWPALSAAACVAAHLAIFFGLGLIGEDFTAPQNVTVKT